MSQVGGMRLCIQAVASRLESCCLGLPDVVFVYAMLSLRRADKVINTYTKGVVGLLSGSDNDAV